MSYPPHLLASRPAVPARRRPGRRFATLLLAAGLSVGAMTGLGASPASADSACAPGTDSCAITGTAQTPLGPVTVAVCAANVTVQLTPTASGTLVIGIPFAIPPGPPGLPGYARTSIPTAGGEVDIDTFIPPPAAANRLPLPDLAIVSIHPPGPCRVRTSGTTVVFTPVLPPGPPC